MNGNPRFEYEFGPFHLDEKERRLLRDGAELVLRENGRDERLPPKAFDLLLALVKRRDHILRREELFETLWPDTFVDDNRLSDNISTLRRFLGDRPKNSHYIETIPKHGYRFVAEVREVGGQLEQTRIVIGEESEMASVDSLDSGGHDFGTPALPPAAVSRRRQDSLLIAAGCLLLGALAVVAYFALRSKTPPPGGRTPLAKSIAVLPFKPLVSARSDPALELGMTDALITKLSNSRQIVVRPTSSVMKYTGEGQDLRAAGSELKVDVLLEGKVQRDGDRIRLTVQLLRPGDVAPLWADKFDEKFTDIFTLQDAISTRVANALALRLSAEERELVAKRYTDNVEAYQLYLKGRQHWRTFTQAGLLTSVNYYNEALKIDPNYALAYTGLANAYSVLGIYGPLTANEAMPKARAAVEKALALDGNLPEAHSALGGNKLFYERDWPGAERELKRALELNPNSVDAHTLYGYYLQAMGKAEEACGVLRRAKDLAPQWFVTDGDLLNCLIDARRYDEAIAESRRILKLEPDNVYANHVLGAALTEKGELSEAILALRRGIEAREDNYRPKLLSQLGYTYGVGGQREQAFKIIARLKARPNLWAPFHLAKIYTGLDDHEQAFAWLDRAADQQFAFLYEIKSQPQFDRLRTDPRYAILLRRLNLAPHVTR